MDSSIKNINIGILALQGAFREHCHFVKKLSSKIDNKSNINLNVIEVRTKNELESCDALIIPGGESTTISLIAERTGLLEPLRKFVKKDKKPVWGTCAGMILLAEEANKTKRGGQELIGGIDIRVNRNHFGRQTESFTTQLKIPFLTNPEIPFECVFIRAPVVDSILKVSDPTKSPVEILATLPDDTIVAIKQDNAFGSSFHPELTNDLRLHEWWLTKCVLPAL